MYSLAPESAWLSRKSGCENTSKASLAKEVVLTEVEKLCAPLPQPAALSYPLACSSKDSLGTKVQAEHMDIQMNTKLQKGATSNFKKDQ